MIQLLFITQLLEVNIKELKCSVTVAFALCISLVSIS